MMELTVNAYAKINLDLYIKGRCPDGYHELSTLMHSLPLCDRVTIKTREGDIRIFCENENVPCDERNIAHRAASAYFAAAGLCSGADITIEKNIPVAGGFGGSSTDGAATLFALEKLFARLGRARLFGLAAALSADMPFCLAAIYKNENAYLPFAAECGGIGDIMREVNSPIEGSYVLAVSDGDGLSAKEMYAGFDNARQIDCNSGTSFRGRLLHNDFEQIAFALRPDIAELKEFLLKNGAECALMSGSGSGVFGIFIKEEDGEACAKALAGGKTGSALCYIGSKTKRYALFDLDGTLTKSAEGILNSVRYALKEMKFAIPDDESLNKFLGPPLVESFMKICAMTEDEAKEALRLYRVYFREKGIFENCPYDGVPKMLETVQRHGIKTVVATSKPEEFAKTVCDHFSLSPYLDCIVGATMDGKISKKSDVIRLAMSRLGINAGDAVMVGDRANDVDGAHACGIPCVGVLYGYGSTDELFRAERLACSPDELCELLCE